MKAKEFVIQYLDIPESDIRDIKQNYMRDTWIVRLWNHRRLEVASELIFDPPAKYGYGLIKITGTNYIPLILKHQHISWRDDAPTD